MKEQKLKGMIQMIPISAIKITDLNIRKLYNEELLSELGRSFSQVGVLHPVVVRPSQKAGEYELILGTRRLKAAQQLQLARIPATILDRIDDPSVLVMALSENLQREDLTPLEEAWAILKLINEYKMNLQSVAKRIGKEESFVRRRLQLISMPKEIQTMVAKKELSIRQAADLARIASPENQVELARIAAKERLSDREFTTLIQDQMRGKMAPPRKAPPTQWTGKRLTLQLRAIALLLQRVMPIIAPAMQGNDALELYKAFQGLEKEIIKAKKSLESKG